MENEKVQLDVWKSVAETYYNAITGVHDSLTALDKDYLSIDRKSLTMCSDMLGSYIDKLECRKGVPPVIPQEIQVVLSLLEYLSKDMDIIREVIEDDIKSLHTEG